MTVQDLINKLEKIKDKEKVVLFAGERAQVEFRWHDHVHDHPHALVIGD
jgi:hypothetical protein